jgi:hypothetical protein
LSFEISAHIILYIKMNNYYQKYGALFMEKNENIDFAAKFNLRGIERVLDGEEIIDAISGS